MKTRLEAHKLIEMIGVGIDLDLEYTKKYLNKIYSVTQDWHLLSLTVQ